MPSAIQSSYMIEPAMCDGVRSAAVTKMENSSAMMAVPSTGLYWGRPEKSVAFVPIPRFVQPITPLQLLTASPGVQEQSPVMVSVLPPWALPYSVHHIPPAVNTISTVSPTSVPTSAIRLACTTSAASVPTNMLSPSNETRSASMRKAVRSSSCSSSSQSLSTMSEVTARQQHVVDSSQANYGVASSPEWSEEGNACADESSRVSCRKHARMRKTRLRPDSSLRTGKRKYRCETCTGILEQWTKIHGARPSESKKQELLSLVGMSPRQLNYWFANRRRTERQEQMRNVNVNMPSSLADDQLKNLPELTPLEKNY